MAVQIVHAEALEYLKSLPDNHVDLTFCSPPYEAARKYGELGFNLRGQQWVDWAVERYVECCRVTKGLVAWVVEGQTRKFQYTASPILLMADLHRKGIPLRKPPLYMREGIPGSGGPDWLKNKYEFIVSSSKGKLPWSDPLAMGHKPKCGKGGPMSNRDRNGLRLFTKQTRRSESGERDPSLARRPMPEKSNPGNIIDCGANTHLGAIAHENEAPFPERLAEFFIRSFCPPSGTVLDCFGGSGTTLAVAVLNDRNAISVDIRESQCELMRRRLAEAGERKLLKDAKAAESLTEIGA